MTAANSIATVVLPLLVKYTPDLLAWTFAALAAYVLPSLRAHLAAGAQKSNALKVVAQVEHLAEVVAAKVWADMKPALSTYAADGKITPDEAKALRDAFVADLKKAMGSEGKDALQSALGLAGDYFDHYVSGLSAKVAASPK